MVRTFERDIQFYKFCLYGFLKNLRFYEPFLLIYLLDRLNDNYVQAMSLYSIRFVLRTILEIPSGVIADALGRKRSLILAYFFYILSFIAYYLANSYAWFLLPSILFGVGDAFRTGTHKAMIVEYLNIKGWSKEKTSYYGYTRSWSQAGSAISALLAAIFLMYFRNYGVIFLATIVSYLIGLILIVSYPKALDKKYDSNYSFFENLQVLAKLSWDTFRNGATIKLLTNTSFYFGFHNAFKDLIQPVLLSSILVLPFSLGLEKGQSVPLLTGLFYFTIYLLSTLASRSAGRINKKFNNSLRTINILSIWGISMSFILSVLLIMDAPLLAAFAFLPFFPILSLQRPSVLSYLSKSTNNKMMTTTLSVESQFGSLVSAILAFVLGISIEFLGLGAGMGIICLFCLAISIVLFVLNRNNEKNNE